MYAELENWKLLQKAQEVTGQIAALLALGTAPLLDDSFKSRLENVCKSLQTLQGELQPVQIESSGA